jgi:sulfide:quinone oxidoreductase
MLLIHEYMKRRGIREKCELAAYTVEGAPMATAGPKAGEFVVGQLKERGIEFHPRRNVKEVEPGRRVVRFEDGQEAPFDLLIAVPPHRAASVAREGGFTGSSPWAPVDPVTLNLKAPGAGENVYAIGDVSVVPLPGRFRPETPLVLPKAGVFADAQGEVVGRNLAAILLRKQPEAKFDGRGFCYIELGDKHAVRGDGSFFDAEHPTMTMRAPDMMQFEEKRTWVRDWMKRRLG